jgi:carbon monoxide dehydrogenase subunit G
VKLEGEYKFDGPREDVWEMVRDPEILATALPGTQSLEQVGDSEYEGVMNIRIGPVGGAFSGRVVISDEQPPEKLVMNVEGKGNPGFVKGTGLVNFVDQGDGTTLMNYEGDLQFGGRLASVGQRLIDTASKSMIRQGLDAINTALQARLAAKSGRTDIDYTAPSEAAFAAAVTKDILGQFISSSTTIYILVAIVIVIIIIVTIIFIS